MADRAESEDETLQHRKVALETATSILQIRQRAEQEIRRANEILKRRTRELAQALVIMRATLDSTTDAILVTDGKARVIDFNENYLAMWKVPREVVENKPLGKTGEMASQCFADPQQFLARIEEIAATGQESFDVLEGKDGRILERSSKVLIIEGQVAGRVWNFRDVTERHLAETTSHRLSAIVASSDDAIVGKDLNSIITSWNSGAERIFGFTAEEMIGKSIMRLIPQDRREEEREILFRIRRGERIDHFETIRLAKNGRQLNVSVTISPIKDSNGRVAGASKVARDIKFTSRGGEVQVRLERIGSQVEVNVSDPGEGIAPDFLPHIFDRFQQGDASTTRRHGGLGLGLAIVKQSVELHGGNVHVKSAGIGRGALFTVRLPLIAVYSERDQERRLPRPEQRENRPLPELGLSYVHVLVVDDEVDARNLVKRLLEMAGATVSMASASEAFDHITTGRPDVLVCDIGMPGEDGYSLIRRLRVLEQRQENALPAVALTAYARSEDRTKAIRSGFQNHLGKPVEPAELLAVVSSLAARKPAIPRGVD